MSSFLQPAFKRRLPLHKTVLEVAAPELLQVVTPEPRPTARFTRRKPALFPDSNPLRRDSRLFRLPWGSASATKIWCLLGQQRRANFLGVKTSETLQPGNPLSEVFDTRKDPNAGSRPPCFWNILQPNEHPIFVAEAVLATTPQNPDQQPAVHAREPAF